MNPRNVFLWPVIISLIGHVALISFSSLIDLRTNVRAAEVFNVQLAEPDEVIDPGVNQSNRKEDPPPEGQAARVEENDREDTVDLGNADIKYAQYLGGVKRKIQRLWVYPVAAYERREEGTSVVRISVDADGTLGQITLMSSSGSAHLDEATLVTVKSAAPFSPLPQSYNLTRLHIMASFRYRMSD